MLSKNFLPIKNIFLFLIAACGFLHAQEPIAVSFRASEIPELAPTDRAGLVPQVNWNNINLGATGALGGSPVFAPLALRDASGADSGAAIRTTIQTGFSANSASLGNSADARMMQGALYLRQADNGVIQVTNIPRNLQTSGYEVLVYFEATTRPRDITVTLGGATAEGNDATTFNGTFVEGTGANVDSNYLRFTGLNSESLSMTVGTVTSAPRAGLAGLQIIPANSIPPVINSFAALPASVKSPAATTTLSWDVSGADSVTITPEVGAVDASGSSTVTPGGDQTYTLTADNAGGTISRDLTVNLVDPNAPNIVIFIVDDFGWQDTSYEFWDQETEWNRLYRTPGMERLGAEGRAFTNAYASGPVCSASRLSILLGQAPVRHGTTFITGLRGRDSATIRSAEQDNGGLDAEEITRTLPTLLSKRGYRSINVGKAHFGPADPLQAGFDRNRYGGANGGPNGNGSNVYQQVVDGEQIHLSEALTIAAKEEVDLAVTADQPFFLYLSHYAVHTPIIEDARFRANYPSVNGTTRAMATLIEGMDKSLRDLLDHLEAKGIAEKTLIFFMSDHGGLSYRGGSSFYNDPPAPNRKFNWPLRGGKNDAYEGGVRIPFFVSWAKNNLSNPIQQALPIQGGSRETRPVIHADLLPTILSITGHSEDVPGVTDGSDVSSYLTGDPSFIREEKFFWHAPNFWIGTQAKPDSAMRDGKYKLVYTYDETDGAWELFDLDSDLGESDNLIETQPEIGVRMARELINYLEAENANYPTLISSGRELRPVMPSQTDMVDLDNDGLFDAEEDLNKNGFVDEGETNPEKADSDGDTTPDLAEIRLGIDPLDPGDFFQLSGKILENGDYQLTWPSRTGTGFDLEASTDLKTWTPLAENIPADSDSAETSFTITPADPQSFYRVSLLPAVE